MVASGKLWLGGPVKTTETSGSVIIAKGATLSLQSALILGNYANDTLTNSGVIVERASGSSSIGPGSTLVNNGTIDAFGGELFVSDTVSGTGLMQIAAGATLAIEDAIGAGQSISFVNGNSKTLILGDQSSFAVSIHAFGGADRIDLPGFDDVSGALSLKWTQATTKEGTLTVTEDGIVAKLTLFGQYSAAGFRTQQESDGHGTVITYTAPAQVTLAAPHR